MADKDITTKNNAKEHRERVKQRFLRDEDFSSYHPYEVLEFLLFFSIPQKDTKPLAKELLSRFGSFHGVVEASYEELTAVPGVGPHTAVMLRSIAPSYRFYMRDRWGERPVLHVKKDAGNFCAGQFVGKRYEELIMLCLSTSWELINVAVLAKGSIDEIYVHPRIAVEMALRHQAKRVILAHNHPGGSTYASRADIEITQTIRESLATISVTLVDHFIITGEDFHSINDQVELQHIRQLADAAEPEQTVPRSKKRKGNENSSDDFLE